MEQKMITSNDNFKENKLVLKNENEKIVTEENVKTDNEENKEEVKEYNYKKTEKYNSRDISWMEFNKRVLNLCKDPSIPLMEQLNFIGISANNLDEFIMVRLGGIIKSMTKNPSSQNINGMIPKTEYKYLDKEIKDFKSEQFKNLNEFLDKCNEIGIKIIKKKTELTPKSRKFINKYFDDKIYGMVTPIVFDSSRPFPLINNQAINIGVLLEDLRFNYNMFGTVQVPDMDRLIEIKAKDIPKGERHFILLEDIISYNISKLFVKKKILNTCYFRVLRNFDDEVTNKQNVFLTDRMKESLKRREFGEIVYLEITKAKKEMLKIIQGALNVTKDNTIKLGNNPIDLRFCMESIQLNDEDKKKYRFKEFTPQLGVDLIGETDIFDAIDRGDVLLHHPYESYDSVVNFVKEAAEDENVVSIKQTLYRLSSNSPIMKALIKAAQNGKQVTVLLEIKARFNEKDNLIWATKLEQAGGHVIYGVNNLKTHCKLTIITKRGRKKNLKQYCHIGTGNYNDVTAKIYTDISLFTSNKHICSDVTNLFNMLTGFSEPQLQKISYAPYNLRETIIKNIDKEIENKGEVVIKVNSLTDKIIIDKLYEASKAGVDIKLIVRGACSLVTDLKGLSDNINVVSNVGRFLEHSRIFYFKSINNAYIGSADLMVRNLDKRFETLTPVCGAEEINRIKDILYVMYYDSHGYELHGKTYTRRDSENKISAQEIMCSKSIQLNKIKNVNKLFIIKK